MLKAPHSRAMIPFTVNVEQISIIGVFYGGQDYETILEDDSGDGLAGVLLTIAADPIHLGGRAGDVGACCL